MSSNRYELNSCLRQVVSDREQSCQNRQMKSHGVPAEDLIVDQVVALQNRLQLLPDVLVVRLRVEVDVTDVLQQGYQLRWQVVAQRLRGCRQLLLQDLLVLFLLVFGVHVLPGELAQEEVDQHVDHALDVVPPALLDAQVRIDGGVPGCPGQVFVVLVGDVSSVEDIFFGQAEVYDEDGAALLIFADEKIVRLDIAMDEALRVDVFDAVEHLQPYHHDGFQGKALAILFEEGFEGATQDLHDHDALFAFCEILVDLSHRKPTLRIPLSLDLPSLSSICRIFDSQNSCGFLEVVFSTLMANFSFRLLKAVQISPKAPEPNFWPTTLYSPQVFMGNQNTDAIINIIKAVEGAATQPPPLFPLTSTYREIISAPGYYNRNKVIMSVARKVSPQRSRERQKVQQLIKQLMRVWNSKNVEQNYQNYYLTYLDSLPEHLVEIEISREIKKTLENKSHFFNINKSLALHTTSIAKLRLAIEKLEAQHKISEGDLEYVCELLDELRSNNMLVAENTLNFNYESSSKSNSQFGFVHGNNYIFEKINADHEFIKSSFLRKYIVFTHSYDPFFLYHYETAKATNDRKYKSHPSIEALFNLSISKAYKIMKLQQEILQFLSGKIPAERSKPRKKPKRYNYSIVNDQNLYKTTITETEAEYRSTNKLENNPYVNNGRSKFRRTGEESKLQKRANTQGDAISQYFQKGIGAERENDRNYLPPIERKQSANVTPSLKNSMVYNTRNHRINSMGNEEEAVLPVTLNNSNLRSSGVNYVRRRVKALNTQLPAKFAKPAPVNQQILHIQEEQLKQMRGASIEVNGPSPNENGLNNGPYQNQMVHYKGPPLIEPEQFLKNSHSTLKNFKLKAGNMTLHSFFIFMRELNIQQKYRKTFEVGNWQHSVRNNQYYLHKFYINEVLMVVSLCCALPEGDYVIKYWAPTSQCDHEMSHFLFRKYLQHVERQTLCKCIFFNANPINEILNSGFQPYKERIFRRERIMPVQVEPFSYYPFLSIDFSSIAIPKSTNKDIQDNIVVPSNVYAPFTEKEFFCFNYLLIINKLINPGKLSNSGSYSPNLGSMKEVQTQMIKRQLFFNPYNLESSAHPINLLTLKMRNPILSAFFVANKPFIKLAGKQIYNDQESVIVTLQFLKDNTVIYFAKGFRSIGDMIAVLRSNPGSYKSVEYCLRMFSKRMRGKINSVNLRDEVCFGDMEVVFEWRDFLKGRLQQSFQELEVFGDKGSFYCLLEIDHENIFAFEVNETNFI